MKHVWTVFVFFWYIYGIDKLLLTSAGIAEQHNKVKTLDLSARKKGNITCGDHAVIRIENATVHAHESYCANNMNNECVLSDNDFKTIENRCNNTHTCTVDYPRNTSCLKQNRYFNLSYSCLVPRKLLCTFELSFCGWKSIPNGGLQWKRYSANKSNITIQHIPGEDHTTKSRDGTFIYLKKKQRSDNGLSATLKRGNFSFDKEKCLVLRYKKDDKSSLIIYTTAHDSPSFNQAENLTDRSWGVISIPLVEGQSFEIVINGTLGNGNSAYIALDDIDIQDWHCDGSLPLSCNFEENCINIRREPDMQQNEQWEISRGAPIDDYGRPPVDHTNGHGFYIYTTSKAQPIKPRRIIIITFDIELKISCLSLWYYKYGMTPGHLNIYTVVKEREEILYSMIDRRTQLWSQFQANVYNATQIILEYNFTDTNVGGIALDDIYISPISCEDEKPFLHACIEKDEELYIRCPVSNVLKEAFAFDSNQTMSCQTTTVQIENNLQQKFRTCNKTPTCKFTPADIVNENNCFNVSKQLQLTYSCINGTEQTTSKTNDENTISTSPQTETTTSVAKRTQTVTSTPQTNVITESLQSDSPSSTPVIVITESLQSDSPSSTPVIGIVVGVVLSLIALSVFLVIAFLYFRRYRYAEKKGHSIVANEDSHSDYTGHQNIAFSPEVNVTTQTDYCEIRKSKLNEHYHDISDTLSPSINTTNDDKYSVIANGVNSPNSNPNPSTNYQHQYISLDPNATGFDRSNPQTNLLNESKNNHNSNEKTSFTSGDDYAILDPDDLNEPKNNTPKILPLSDNYVVLDPNETGFNRQENTDRVCNYDLATPTVTSEDPYDVSKDETYDTSSNSRHKEKENNIYSHTVDNVYDTAGNQRKKEESDGTYDHFFGQKSEDDYDISKPI